MIKPVILLVDNDHDALQNVQEFLECCGYTVHTAQDVDTARQIARQHVLALAVLDYRLRDDDDQFDESGLQLAQDPHWAPATPRIMLTRFEYLENVRRALTPPPGGEPLVLNYISKREDLESLHQAIERILSRRKVFLCYAQPDAERVRWLYDQLCAAGFAPWMASQSLMGGEEWELVIRQQLKQSDVVLISLSQAAVNRPGYFQKEVKLALEFRDYFPEGANVVIPIRWDDCEMPHEELRALQWVDMFAADGLERLKRALAHGPLPSS